MAMREFQEGACAPGTLGHVVAAELPRIHCGGCEYLGEPALLIEWVGSAELTILSFEEYRQDVQEL
jgi:hypothetical protein